MTCVANETFGDIRSVDAGTWYVGHVPEGPEPAPPSGTGTDASVPQPTANTAKSVLLIMDRI
jgi:hypothetical protein